MKAAAIQDIKEELSHLSAKQLSVLCLKLAKFKKDNKEFLSYLLFEEKDLTGYINAVKDEVDLLFSEINSSHVYYAKKTLRKILRITTRHIRYTASPQAEATLLIYFCEKMQGLNLPMERNTVLFNLYQSQLKKIKSAIAGFHEDLRYDYEKELKLLESTSRS